MTKVMIVTVTALLLAACTSNPNYHQPNSWHQGHQPSAPSPTGPTV